MEEELIQDDVQGALAGNGVALRNLVAALTPVIQARVTRVLLRSTGRSPGRDVRQEVEDLSQEIFLFLFADGARVLLTWQPERGLSLLNFVGLIAERQTISILRSGKRNPWQEDPTLTEELDDADPFAGPEQVAVSRQNLRHLLERLHGNLSPLGRHLFILLFLRELSVEEVVRETRMSSEAVYAWRSRLRRLAHRMHAEMTNTGEVVRNRGPDANSPMEAI